MVIPHDWDESLDEQLLAMYQSLELNMQMQSYCMEAYEKSDNDEYSDKADKIADSLPITISVGNHSVTMPCVAPVYDSLRQAIIALASEYMIDLPETTAQNEELLTKAMDLLAEETCTDDADYEIDDEIDD